MRKSHLIAVAALALGMGLSTAKADFIETIVQPQPVGPPIGPDIPDIFTAEGIINSPPTGATITNTTAPTINDGFGSITNPDYFAVRYVGQITSLDGNSTPGFSAVKTLYVNSDDGFRFLLNNVTPAGSGNNGLFEFITPTGNSNVTSAPLTLTVGDFIQLDYFERNGGQFVTLRENNGNGAVVNDIGGGSTIGISTPEPASLGLLGLGGLGLLARRRRA